MSAPPSPKLRHFVLALMIPFSWSFSFIAGRYVMTETPGGPATVTFLRFVVALVLLLPLLLKLPALGRLSANDRVRMVLLSLCCVGLYHYLFYKGLIYAPAGMSSIVLAVLPILINIGAGLLLGETIGRKTYFGAVLAFVGISVIALEKGGWTLAGWGRGETYIFLAALAWLVYTLASRSFFHKHDPTVASIHIFVVGTALVLPVAVFEPTFSRLGDLSWAWWASTVYMGAVATGFGYVAFNSSLRHLGAGKTAVFLLIIPPITNLWDRLIFGTPLTIVKSICIGVVVFGVWLALKRK